MTATTSSEVTIRQATAADLDAAIELVGRALGWDPDRPNAAFFRWKHLENPFGPSPMWVAERDGQLVGVRTFLRWEFIRPDGTTARAVRAVDTATDPASAGRGIFTALTMHAAEQLTTEGVDFVFNTPNDKSRPGYLKMGWVDLGRVPVRVRLRSFAAAARVARARVAADKWSRPTTCGEDPLEVFASDHDVQDLLDRLPPDRRHYVTARSPAQLRWRYSFAPLHYRAVTLSDRGVSDGVCVFRVRARGPATEATVCDLLVPGGDTKRTRALLRAVALAAPVDYLIWTGPRLPLQTQFLPLPGQGPVLTWRALRQAEPPPLSAWALTLADLELF
ncbi:MAG: GNAT family N-acetyltransferase [Acidimicrobiales bacterium]|nr:GNAT family N-acetyltransferase [Acidimicrobiales bacterium]